MKRKLALIMCVIVAVAMVFTLASCGEEQCEHTYSAEYTTDANGHWYVATCGCEGEVSNYGAHVDSNNNGECDTCKYKMCEHTYSTDWSTDKDNHWNDSTCDCTATQANKAAHEDKVVNADKSEGKDGICDVCNYVMCTHTPKAEWSNDENGHWKDANCDCTTATKTQEGAHVDADKDGVCDTCAYVMCEHTYATEWSSDAAYHWYAATCGCDVVDSKAEHVNEDEDKLCDVCGANICEHTFEETLSHDETHHWYASTCGCDVKKDYAEHTWGTVVEESQHYTGATCGCGYEKDVAPHADEDEDGKCDTCEADMTLMNVIGGIDQEANAGANNIVIDVDKTVYSDYGDTVTDSIVSVEYYDNYAVYKDVDGYTYYYTYYGENNTQLFAIIVDGDGNASRNGYAEYPTGGATIYISLVYGNVYTYNGNIEAIVTGLYNLGSAKKQEWGYSYCFTKSYNEETGAYAFSYVYFEDNAYEVKVEFTVAENAIATATIEINAYATDDVTVDGNTYTVAEEAKKVQEEKYVITQAFGDPMASTDAPNPYPAADYIVTEDFKLGVKDSDGNVTEIEDGATVELDAAKDAYFYFSDALKDVLGFNNIKTTVYDSEDYESYKVSSYYDSFENAIYVKSNYADTYKVVVDVEGVEFTFNIKVNYLAPEAINPAVVKGYDEIKVTEYQMYGGKTLTVTAKVELGCDPTFTASIPEDAAATLTLNEDGTYTFTPSTVGEFVITFTSTKAPEVTSELKITVIDPPSPADLLKGEQEYVEEAYITTKVSVVFTPEYEGAANGTVVISYLEEGYWETKELKSTYTYRFSPAGVALTFVEGDDAGFGIKFSDDYEVVVTYPPYGVGTESIYLAEYVLKVKEPSDGNGTGKLSDPYVLTETGDYTCAFPGGYNAVWYEYKAEVDGTMTVSTTYATGWLLLGTDDYTAGNNQNYGDGSSVTLSVTAGTTYLIGVGDWNEETVDVPFSIVVE